jgi:hypothetical protein
MSTLDFFSELRLVEIKRGVYAAIWILKMIIAFLTHFNNDA